MKKIRNTIIAFVVTALLAEPLIVMGEMPTVKAAGVSELYTQMKVEDISFGSEDIDKDALEITNNDFKIPIDVTVNVPEGWAVSVVEVAWTPRNEDNYYNHIASETYSNANQPEDGVYSLELDMHKYMTEDTYCLSEISVEFVSLSDKNAYYCLYGYSDEEILATKENPTEFYWEAFDSEWNDYSLKSTMYDGELDYTIKTATGVDTKVPLITKIKMKSSGVLDGKTPTEIDVTFKENDSGIKYIYMMSEAELGVEDLYLEADYAEQYKGTSTVTLKTDKEQMEYRDSGKYSVFMIYVEDYAGNYIEYYLDEDNGDWLIGYEVTESDDSYDKTKYKIETVRYSVCKKHSYVDALTKATTTKNGKTFKECEYCGKDKDGSSKTIYRIDEKKTKLSKTSYTYSGKTQKPTVTVYDSKGKKISSSNYKVSYTTDCKSVGEHKVKIKFKNNYSGTIYKTYTIKPKGTSLSSVSGGKKKITVKWKKQTSQTSGYQVMYSTSSSFKSYKTKNVSGKSSTSVSIKSLKAKKKYYVKVRTYKTVKIDGKSKKIYSSWSKVKSVKTK